MAQIDQFLKVLVEQGGSDLHLTVGSPPVMRVHGHLQRIKFRELSNTDLEALVYEIMEEEWRITFVERQDYDFAYEIEGLARFRANVFWQRKGMGCVLRTIPSRILTADDLKLPEAVRKMCMLTKGLVLVTGPTGSGKSTTLAAMVDLINSTRSEHVLTIEDPIEFVHANKKALVNQREIRTNTKSFANALRAALREDPDVIMVGEMRDQETIELGITAAETGHLVFGTLHTSSAPKTVDRIIDVFPADEQEQIRSMLAESLKGVIAQVLLRAKDGKSRMAAWEIMVGTSAIGNLIRENKIHQIPSIIQTGKKDGMQLLDQHILEFLMSGKISAEEAYMKANNKQAFLQHLEAPPETDFA
ncbi:MAG: type IV pilus twitching motility protein PilT [Gemmatimonadetes bacterium]|nr:type IV pilus twitching motility protein PilT [Gemmatimonadota bacterium]MDA1102688.1 type IV pilus twitching motility protein PilT [Gemmatimonadota bacterium]